MKKPAALLAVLAVACSQPAPNAQKPAVSPTPAVSPIQAASPSPVPSPTDFDLPLSAVGFSCRLPISTPDGHGGFISFPANTVSFDLRAKGLLTRGGAYYDRAFSRWLPVARQAVSPDGKHFAYGEEGSDQSHSARMHVVDVATGADHVFDASTGAWYVRYQVLDYAAEGIYLYTYYEVSYGVALMNPTTGAIHAVASLPDIQASAGNRAFWVGTVNPADPNPLGGIAIQPNQIDRYSALDGSRVAWFYRPSTAPRVVGSDLQGHPIVLVVNGRNGVNDGAYGEEFVLLLNPQSQRSMFSGSAKTVSSSSLSISDSHGTWFGTDHGVYLYTGTALMKVSNQPGYPANGCF
ncbi:MAG: hypothetical protein E6I73_02800 [Chloroflexi bacterium]|nr:MAG: hypothetical protein E6I73_02800 [Chloroflexota bacterium]